jgi:intein-encoded DNA endonuclease-like protein
METKTIEEPLVITKAASGNKYDIPEVRQYIKIKRDDGLSWSQIAEGLKDRGFDKISPTVCMNLYTTMIARSTVTHNTAKEVFDDHTDAIKESYDQAISVIGTLVRRLRKIVEEIPEDDTSDKLMVLKTIPFAVSIMKEIREGVEFQASLQDKITKEGTKQIEMTAAETMDFLNKYQDEVIKEKILEIARSIAKELELNDTYVPKIKSTIQKAIK